ncbi:methyltransferase domain-containing protein [Coraliomargarita sp. W4R53]
MAIIWQQVIEDNHYEVRTAGASVRLYRNGVNHSQWNPNRPLSGSIWDLITLPTLHRPAGSIKDVLVLGFGAGSVGRQIRELVEPDRIVGVELDPIHLSIADGFFECSEGCELVAADAVEWVHEGGDEASYDVIIDDLYAEQDGIPVRCVPMDVEWCEALCGLLKPGGMLIFNMIEPDKIKHLPMFKSPKLKQRYSETIMYRIDGYENRIVAFSDQAFDLASLDDQLKRIYKKYPACRGVRDRYILDTVKA